MPLSCDLKAPGLVDWQDKLSCGYSLALGCIGLSDSDHDGRWHPYWEVVLGPYYTNHKGKNSQEDEFTKGQDQTQRG